MTEADEHMDFDLEVEPEDAGQEALETELGGPCLVVDDLHVVYRVIGGRAKKEAEQGAEVREIKLKVPFHKRLLRAGRRHVGAVSEVHAVRGVSFTVRHGESVGIVGVNGSGKSTMLRAIAGLMPPKSGSVHVSGEPSLLGVNAALMPSLTGERNIMIGGLALGLTPKQVDEKFDEVVEFSGIGDFVYLPMKTYSSGMGARLRFAISSAASPDILMIDEALATGDAAFKERSKSRIEDVRANAGTVFLVSHSISTIEAMCTRVLWMHQGQLVMDGPVHEVADAYKNFVRAQRPGMGPARRRALQRKRAAEEAAKKKAEEAEQKKAEAQALKAEEARA
ncbi:teichoic acid transport system ATP-binding protein [Promicromonospora sp. AC04]|uniref:ABC transporter ATP-binding protein n=1 Tax=Promicromonospora sp. AC04 TaxID=2135723 RepID=UPI000D380FF8|nr:ABC transporter ATP-binding protein [Promicromonospora sp. AC04]PUB20149.1 teichoic acid transport system ATP-binding protein [Promicromonospora sp. AC04]